MSNGITLTSAMRNNLGALKYLSGQMDITQTRLATGQKVNSAIDNASSFYQARALTNRAGDLDRLLDSMGQSIQTINAAISGLEHAGATLEQAAVVAQQAYEAAIIPEKAWFEAQVGENGAVVATAQELKDAVDSGKETICVYGKIDMGEITSGLTLKSGQKLVGIGYFGDFDSEVNKFSSISATTKGNINLIGCSKGNNEIANLSISYKGDGLDARSCSVISCTSSANLYNIDIDYAKEGGTASGAVAVSGENTIVTTCDMVIKNRYIAEGSGATVAILVRNLAKLEIDGYFVTDNNSRGALATTYSSSVNGAQIAVKDTAKLYVLTNKNIFYNQSPKEDNTPNQMNIAAGAQLVIDDGVAAKGYQLNSDWESVAVNRDIVTLDNVEDKLDLAPVAAWDYQSILNNNQAKDGTELNKIAVQYGEMMSAYDDMIKDSSYQGINLLTGGNMTTMFNETRSNSFKVEGADMTAESLGITTREWQTKEDIAQSIKEIKDAMFKVRDMVEVLGNNLSIIETRMNFTDALTDILQIGADELVLADINEESANYLALQTRQQLAVNALSLAAQSSSAVLKLF